MTRPETPAAIPARLDGRAAAPVESFLAQTAHVDLDALLGGGFGAAATEANADRQQVIALAARLAEAEFKPLLEWLLDASLRRPVHLPGFGPEATAYCALREGQNQIVWLLLQAIAEGRGELPPYREGQS